MSGEKNAPVRIPVEVPEIPDVTRSLPCFWMTRDRIGGVLMSVDVWALAPERVEYPDGEVVWLEPEAAAIARERIAAKAWPFPSDGIPLAVDEHDSVIDEWTIEEAKRRYPGAPDCDRECVRVGEPPVVRTALN